MIDITEKGTAWVERWEEVTFSPSHLFSKEKFKLDSTAFLFATGCLLMGYCSAMLGAAAFFWRYYPRNLQSHLKPGNFKETAAELTIMSGLYVGVTIGLLLFTSAVSYAGYRFLGSTRRFTDHFAAELHFLNMEPLPSLSLMVATLAGTSHNALVLIALSGIFVTRVYYLVLAYVAFEGLHNLPQRRQKLSFFIGYLPVALVSALTQFFVFSLMAGAVIGGLD